MPQLAAPPLHYPLAYGPMVPAAPPAEPRAPRGRGARSGPHEGGFRCDDCGKTYHHQPSLRSHKRFQCGKEPQFQCPYCPHRSKLKGNLKKHVREMHKDFQPLL